MKMTLTFMQDAAALKDAILVDAWIRTSSCWKERKSGRAGGCV